MKLKLLAANVVGFLMIVCILIVKFVGFGSNMPKTTIDNGSTVMMILAIVLFIANLNFILLNKSLENKTLYTAGSNVILLGYLLFNVVNALCIELYGNMNTFITINAVVFILAIIVIILLFVSASKKEVVKNGQ